ncbi:MAG: tetratricopeptide repeat protein [Bacteroides sp.]|nr:tetratricopeptide repeat protein [Ruminococcus flavefaciens]MCM1555282.1 tetratricopeptide repeat protein [Bacteroides sp.]
MLLKCNVKATVLYCERFFAPLARLFPLFVLLLGGRAFATEEDSLQAFDRLLSYQSDLSAQERITITRKAEDYARSKGNIFKAYSYAAQRGYLYFSVDESDSCLAINSVLIPSIESFVRETGEDRWKIMLVDCYSDVALCKMYGEQSDSAMLIYQGLLLRFEHDTVSYLQAKCLNGIGVVFAYQKLFDLAEDYFLSALEKYTLAGHMWGVFAVSSNLVAFFQIQGQYEAALPYGIRAYRIAHAEHYNGQEQIYASLAMGTIYSGMEQYDIAAPYFEEALKLAKDKNFTHMEGFAEASQARNLYHLGKYAQARQVAENALRQIKDKKKYSLQMDLLQILIDVAEKQNDMNASLRYLREYTVVRNSQMDMENMRQLLNVQNQYDTYRREQEARNDVNEFKLTKARAQNRVLWIIMLSTSVVLLVVVVLLLARRMFKFRKAAVLLKEESRQQIKTAEEQIEIKNKELATNALQFLRLNNLQENILKELKHLKTAFTLRAREKRAVCEIEELVQQIASEREWKDFQFYFEQVDKEFMLKLSERFPDLTANEKHLCVLFNLGLTNKDVANLTGRSLQSVGMAKFRLKSKLKLENSDELTQFLNAL